jgi:phosphatidylcholine synthase
MPPLCERGIAWSVHLLTASGAALCLLALRAAAAARWQEAFCWLTAAVLVDGVDGGLARWARVKEVLPHVDGALLDNLIDFTSYVIVPAFILQRSDLLPATVSLAAAATICLASAYQFSNKQAKTGDHYFTGFPSYWNVVVFYLMVMKLGPLANLAIIAVLAVLVFVPIRYVYPSRTARFRPLTLTLTALWGCMVAIMLYEFPDPAPWLVWLSCSYLAYYAGLSAYLMAVPRRVSTQ